MSDQQINEFLEVCQSFRNAMLVTTTDDGMMQARPMVIAKLEENGDLWFATDRDSGKVDEVLETPKVCVTMADGTQYASITGFAEVVCDQVAVDQLWSEPWRVWFPEGPTDARIVLIKVHAIEGEYWSNAGANRIKYLVDAAKAYATGKRLTETRESQHGHVHL